jgi:hypothetical protein
MSGQRFVLVVAAAVLLLGGQPLGGRAAGTDPVIVAGHKDGEIALPFNWTTVASLPVPQGSWVIVAKAFIVGGGGATCHLVADGQFDEARREGEAGEITLLITRTFNGLSGGNANLDCVGADTGAWISWIKIIAIASSAALVSADGPTDVPGGGVFGTLASASLPSGNYWVIAKTSAHLTGSRLAGERLSCKLTLKDSRGTSTDPTSEVIPKGLTVSVAMEQTRHIGSGGGTARLRCTTSGGTGGMQSLFVRMVAIPVSTLVSGPLGGTFSTNGTGSPRVRAGSKAGPVNLPIGSTISVGKLTLPAGKWAIFATAYGSDPISGQGGLLQCDLLTPPGSDHDPLPSIIVDENYPLTQRAITLAVVHDYGAAGGSAKLTCKATLAALELYAVRIVAIKAASLTNIAL